jgi:hypothetical protein
MTSLSGLFFALALRPDFDPVASLAALLRFEKEQISEAQKKGDSLSLSNAIESIVKKANELTAGVEVAKVESRQCLALAQIYGRGQQFGLGVAATERFMTTADSFEVPGAKRMAIQFACAGNLPDKAIEHSITFPLVNFKISCQFIDYWTTEPVFVIQEFAGYEKSLDMARDFETKLDALSGREPAMYRTAISQLRVRSAQMLLVNNQKAQAIERLQTGIAKLPPDTPNGMKTMLTRLELEGKPIPKPDIELTLQTGLVVVEPKAKLDIAFVHWNPAALRMLVALQKFYKEELAAKVEFSALTGYFGFFGTENQKDRQMAPAVESEHLQKRLSSLGITFTVQIGPLSNFEKWGVDQLPYLIVSDPNQNVRKVYSPFTENDMASLRALLKEMVEKS